MLKKFEEQTPKIESDKNINFKTNILMKENSFLVSPKVMRMMRIGICIMMFLFLNYVINFFLNLNKLLQDLDNPLKYIGFLNFFKFDPHYIYLYLIVLLISYGLAAWLSYKIKIAYAPMNVGQKGNQRFTSLSEIKEQYKEVIERDTDVPGKGGFIVSRHKDKVYIDDSSVNNLIIGTTRSGKGEMVIFPMIDIYSRATEKSSLIIADPKLEIYSSSYDILIERGYEVYVLNLIEPTLSMFYNPLQIIVDAYKAGDYSQAELLCNTYAYSVFNQADSNVDAKFWANNSANLLSALILAHIEDCLNADQRINERNREIFEQKKGLFVELNEEEQQKIREYIISENIDGMELMLLDAIPLEYDYTPTRENEKKINMYSIINLFQELANITIMDESSNYYGQSMLDVYFGQRPELNIAKMKYSAVGLSGHRTKGSIFSNFLAELTIFTYQEIAKMTASNSLNLKDIGYGKKPVAVFLGIPDYDRSKNFLASIFIRQLYFVLAKEATHTLSGMTDREVVFILDEFGNIPPVESFDSIITVCLGRNIKFNLFLQSLAQGKTLYKDAWDTILENCANKMYILSSDEKTSETFSKMCGSRTFMNPNRVGKKFSLNKTVTESYDEQPLLSSNQIMNLKPGENIIIRTIKRTDQKGESITSFPILNCMEFDTHYKYRYQYLLDIFPQDKLWTEHPIKRTDNINLKDYVYHNNMIKSPDMAAVEEYNQWPQLKQMLKKHYDDAELNQLKALSARDFLKTLTADRKLNAKALEYVRSMLNFMIQERR